MSGERFVSPRYRRQRYAGGGKCSAMLRPNKAGPKRWLGRLLFNADHAGEQTQEDFLDGIGLVQ
jgi:hypothetical protein